MPCNEQGTNERAGLIYTPNPIQPNPTLSVRLDFLINQEEHLWRDRSVRWLDSYSYVIKNIEHCGEIDRSIDRLVSFRFLGPPVCRVPEHSPQ